MALLAYMDDNRTLHNVPTTSNLDENGVNVWTEKFPAKVSVVNSLTGSGWEYLSDRGLFYNGTPVALDTSWVDVSSYLSVSCYISGGSNYSATPTFAKLNKATGEILIRFIFPITLSSASFYIHITGVTTALNAYGFSNLLNDSMTTFSMNHATSVGRLENAVCQENYTGFYARSTPGTTSSYPFMVRIIPVFGSVT